MERPGGLEQSIMVRKTKDAGDLPKRVANGERGVKKAVPIWVAEAGRRRQVSGHPDVGGGGNLGLLRSE